MTDGQPESLSASASARVQAILEAAEASAAEIRREAEADAAQLRERARAEAGREAEAIDAAIGRLRSLHAELGAVIDSLGADGRHPPAPAPEEPDSAGVRLIALDMALDGTPREELAAYLAAHHASLADPGALLDDVYASVGD